MKLEILVTTMNQVDFSLLDKMNIQTNVIVVNQANKFSFEERMKNNYRIRMITTPFRGVSRNRNLALSYIDPQTDYILFADDDLCFVDDYEKIIEQDLTQHPEAEAIHYNLENLSKYRKITMKKIQRWHKATRLDIGAAGVCGLMVNVEALRKHDLHFCEYFGPGRNLYAGEDTIFLNKMVASGLRIFFSSMTIAGIDQTESSWFEGHNEKYFYVNGNILAAMYHELAYFLIIRSAWRQGKRNDVYMSRWEILRCLFRGVHSYLKR